ncbi:hypothetical protein HALDL1_02275 [Halobacterium sp. DL1]|jgi:hypothetical protein|nr:hypothetical protein HALDL1_02275 [Halobacterium sp. DL1]
MTGHIRTLGVIAVALAVALSGGAAAAALSSPTTAQSTVSQTDAAASLQEGNASVAFDDQTTNTTVMVQSVTVPEGGYAVIHATSGPNNETVGDVVGVSDYLEPGTHENVTVTLYEDVPGAEFQNTSVNGTQTFVAMAHQETSQTGQPTTTTTPADNATTTTPAGNETTTPAGNATTTTTTPADNATAGNATNTFDYLTSNMEEDGPYLANGEPVTDSAQVTFEGAAAQQQGLTVESLSAPAYVMPGENVTVNATVTNQGSESIEEDVAFRIAGGDVDVVLRQNVTVSAGESTNVTFDVDTAGVLEGEYIHGVTTENSSAFAQIAVTNDSAVAFADQNATDNVTVEDVFVPEGGYVTIHNSNALNAPVESVIGTSEYLEAGYHENVSVTLYDDVEGADFQNDSVSDVQTFVAMTHLDTNGNQQYDFVTSDGQDDGPYTIDGQAVVDTAIVMPEDAEGNQTTTTTTTTTTPTTTTTTENNTTTTTTT